MIKKLTQKEYTKSTWSGGRTTEIAIYPENKKYADRDFLWRVSSATVELPESDYTDLPDYDRLITPLGGEMILSHDGGEETSVEPLEVYAFDGAQKTHCRGICTDFNLMTRKDKCMGQMAVLDVDQENAVMLSPLTKAQTVVLYLVEGTARLIASGTEDDILLKTGDSLLITDEKVEMALESDDYAVFTLACTEVL